MCFVTAALFAGSMLHYSTRLIVSGLFIEAMLASIVSLTLFLREVYFAIEIFEIGLPALAREKATIAACMHNTARSRPLSPDLFREVTLLRTNVDCSNFRLRWFQVVRVNLDRPVGGDRMAIEFESVTRVTSGCKWAPVGSSATLVSSPTEIRRTLGRPSNSREPAP